jgi:tetratricopeptide (TPR) repeat protein
MAMEGAWVSGAREVADLLQQFENRSHEITADTAALRKRPKGDDEREPSPTPLVAGGELAIASSMPTAARVHPGTSPRSIGDEHIEDISARGPWLARRRGRRRRERRRRVILPTNVLAALRAFIAGYAAQIRHYLSGSAHDRERALAHYQEALEAQPHYSRAAYNRAVLLYNRYQRKANDEAIACFAAATRSHDARDRALAFAGLAMAYCQVVHRFEHRWRTTTRGGSCSTYSTTRRERLRGRSSTSGMRWPLIRTRSRTPT